MLATHFATHRVFATEIREKSGLDLLIGLVCDGDDLGIQVSFQMIDGLEGCPPVTLRLPGFDPANDLHDVGLAIDKIAEAAVKQVADWKAMRGEIADEVEKQQRLADVRLSDHRLYAAPNESKTIGRTG